MHDLLDEPPAPHQILARRVARLAFGIAVLAGVGLLIGAACRGALATSTRAGLDARLVVGLIWLAAALAASIAGALARRLAWRRPFAPGALFVASLVVPTAGILLLLPITFHLALAVPLRVTGPDFNAWVEVSMLLAGPAHLVGAALCMRRVHRLAIGEPAMSPRKIYVITVITACVPFVIVVLPPLLVAGTGLPFVSMLHAVERLIDRERAELAQMPHRLPGARTVRRRRL